MKSSLVAVLFFTLSLMFSFQSLAAGGKGGSSIGVGLGLITADQVDVDNYITSLNTAGTKNLGSGMEAYFDYSYRFGSTMFALLFRPSYMSHSATGGNVTATMTGFTMFPILRMYPLENNFMKFLLQVGVGYGSLNGSLTNGSSSVKFSGGTFGAIAGLGAEFCFTASHCMSVEGNLRYLPIARNIVSSASGNMGGSIGTPTNGGELEANNTDIATTMGGIQGLVGYKMYF